MIIIEAPYVSTPMQEWLEDSQHPVLANDFAKEVACSGRNLNLVSDEEASSLVESGHRIYTCSENALAWVLDNINDENLSRCIKMSKDKAEARRALAAMDSVFFNELTMEQLKSLDPSTLEFPLVIKPSVGFVSFAVHAVLTQDQWDETVVTLDKEISAGSVFPESVVGSGMFIIEGFITGQEYAVDVYFDADGSPVVLDVMQHDFLDDNDTSDHMYFTNAAIMNKAVPALTSWFAQANGTLGFRDFCTHVELRVTCNESEDPLDAMDDPSKIHIIEFNPLRFAGFCGTDLGLFAYGIHTYKWYLENLKPAAGTFDMEGTTAFIVMEKGENVDVDAFKADLLACGDDLEICDFRPMDSAKHGISAFPIFKCTNPETWEKAHKFGLEIDVARYER